MKELEDLKRELQHIAVTGSKESFAPLAKIYGVINKEIEKLKK